MFMQMIVSQFLLSMIKIARFRDRRLSREMVVFIKNLLGIQKTAWKI